MNRALRFVLIVGARPNFMKVAPLIKAIRRHNERIGYPAQDGVSKYEASQLAEADALCEVQRGSRGAHSLTSGEGRRSCVPAASGFRGTVPIRFQLVHTGQHYDEQMSTVFFRELGIAAPDVNLGVGSGSHAVQTASVMCKFEPVLLNWFGSRKETRQEAGPGRVQGQKAAGGAQVDTGSRYGSGSASAISVDTGSVLPDWCVVVGDVNSTMACALVAVKLGVKVAHVEAGLRSFDRSMPEEVNRLVTDAVADLLLTPSEDASENLRQEGVSNERIKLVGNIMIDSLVENLEKARKSEVLRRCGVLPGKFVYVTLHRPANVDSPETLSGIVSKLKELSRQMAVVFPLHPRTRRMAAAHGVDIADDTRFRVLDPIGYHDSLCLAENARLVLTDSGGLQEETTYFRTPCLTLRRSTERPITTTVGSNRLTDVASLSADVEALLRRDMRIGNVPPLWDGGTAERILDLLANRWPTHTPYP